MIEGGMSDGCLMNVCLLGLRAQIKHKLNEVKLPSSSLASSLLFC